MNRETFETNPGLCELFKRKILDRAETTGLSKDRIDFESQIDMKGTFHDNLRTFYREYPQLAQDSDYLRLKTPRPLTGVALEQLWRSYQRSNEQPNHPKPVALIHPHLTITYSFDREHTTAGPEQKKRPETISGNTTVAGAETPHSELMRLLLDRVTAIAGENVTQTILHQLGREIGSAAFHHSGNQTPGANAAAALDNALRARALGRLKDLKEIDERSSLTYVCTVEECSLCRKGGAAASTCNIMRGIVTRWFESHLRKRAERIERHCVNTDPHLCVFRVTFRK